MEKVTEQNLDQVKKELEDICTKYGITLVPVVVHQGNRTFSSIEIVPVQAQEQQAPEVSTDEAPKAE